MDTTLIQLLNHIFDLEVENARLKMVQDDLQKKIEQYDTILKAQQTNEQAAQ